MIHYFVGVGLICYGAGLASAVLGGELWAGRSRIRRALRRQARQKVCQRPIYEAAASRPIWGQR